MLSRLAQLLADAKSQGASGAVKYVMHRLYENYHERRLGIKTGREVYLEELGINNPEFHNYSPMGYYAFKTVLKEAISQVPGGVFLDYGCGMGRVLVLAAAAYPFRRIIGVELCPEFVAVARENLKRVERKVKCKDVRIITTDAAHYAVPEDVTHIHLYNPFTGKTLADVVENMRQSLVRRPRRLAVLVSNSDDFDGLAQKSGFLRKHRDYKFYPNQTSYAIYECRGAPDESSLCRLADGSPSGD